MVKDGIIHDAAQLRRDVREMAQMGIPPGPMPIETLLFALKRRRGRLTACFPARGVVARRLADFLVHARAAEIASFSVVEQVVETRASAPGPSSLSRIPVSPGGGPH